MKKASDEWLSHLAMTRDWLDARLLAFLDRSHWHPRMKESAEYVVSGGGKAVRPALVYWSYASASGNSQPPEWVLDLGLSLEFVHCYSLAHDDLPCMDNDDFRRGRPTLHRIQGEALAVLGGDALLTGAFEIVSNLAADSDVRVAAVREIAAAAGGAGMIAGQAMDLELKLKSGDWTTEELTLNHNLKTGALFGASLALGALAAGRRDPDKARYWGIKLGLLFQVVDDILDAGSATDARGDEGPNFVKALGLNEARKYADQLRTELKSSAQLDLGATADSTEAILDFFVQRKF